MPLRHLVRVRYTAKRRWTQHVKHTFFSFFLHFVYAPFINITLSKYQTKLTNASIWIPTNVLSLVHTQSATHPHTWCGHIRKPSAFVSLSISECTENSQTAATVHDHHIRMLFSTENRRKSRRACHLRWFALQSPNEYRQRTMLYIVEVDSRKPFVAFWWLC